MNQYWSLGDVAAQNDRIAIVTGANTGIGFETALGLAGKGARVILACRNHDKAECAKQRITNRFPYAEVETRPLDTGSQQSVRDFAQAFSRDYKRLDILVNNAGVMLTPYFVTEDSLEGHFGVNYLGHFLLSGLLLPMLTATENSRIVTLYSLAHQWHGIRFDDLQFRKQYNPRQAYAQSKMACLMFSLELNKRLQQAGHGTISLASHPGYARSEGTRSMPTLLKLFIAMVDRFALQSAEEGALSILYAALGEDLQGGEAIGPGGYKQRKGAPTVVDFAAEALSQERRERLWSISEQLSHFNYTI